MSGLSYSESQPLNSKDRYSALETVDFILDFPQKKLVLGSIRIEGKLLCQSDTGARNDTELIQMDGSVGIHQCVDSVNVELQTQGVIENISSDYGRYVKILASTSLDEDNYHQASKVTELRCASDRVGRAICRGVANPLEDISFSFKPHICLNNNAGGEGLLSYRKSGYVRISVNLTSNANMFFGMDMTATQQYHLSDLRCRYMTADDDGRDQPNLLKTTYTLKNSLNSQNSNISSKVPAVCSGVTISFLAQAREALLDFNSLALERPLNISQVQYLFNDSNKYITYSLQNEEEYLQNALDSLQATGVSGVSASSLKANEGFLLGTRFGGLVDLSVNNFNLQITSGISANDPHIVYQVFHSQTTV